MAILPYGGAMTARGPSRYAAVDVYYPPPGGAVAAAVIASDPAFATITAEHVTTLAEAAPYRPGHFADRELPALRAVLTKAGSPIDLLIVDGYVDLDPQGLPGLGAHAHAAFGVPVIGVAKSAFLAATHAVPVQRGTGHRPLYVTAAGLTAEKAAELVRNMSGAYRIPDALRRVDALTRVAP